jgi:hypothetical protein
VARAIIEGTQGEGRQQRSPGQVRADPQEGEQDESTEEGGAAHEGNRDAARLACARGRILAPIDPAPAKGQGRQDRGGEEDGHEARAELDERVQFGQGAHASAE